jgi:hypothetical protein
LSDSDQPQPDWGDLDADQQTALRVEFGRWLDGLPPICSLEAKIARCRHGLHERGIDYHG